MILSEQLLDFERSIGMGITVHVYHAVKDDAVELICDIIDCEDNLVAKTTNTQFDYAGIEKWIRDIGNRFISAADIMDAFSV